MGFDEFWKIYPHCTHPPRSKKAVCRQLFEQITTTGRKAVVDGIQLKLKAEAWQIIEAAKLFAKAIDSDWEQPDKINRQYVPGAQVWLGQGRWEDYEEHLTRDNVVAIK